jgi:hypothetical protein
MKAFREIAWKVRKKGELWLMGSRGSRQAVAVENTERRGKRSDAQQLAQLEARGHGHCREAEKLRKQPAPEESKESK